MWKTFNTGYISVEKFSNSQVKKDFSSSTKMLENILPFSAMGFFEHCTLSSEGFIQTYIER
jgi:hypothetical protein